MKIQIPRQRSKAKIIEKNVKSKCKAETHLQTKAWTRSQVYLYTKDEDMAVNIHIQRCTCALSAQ